jgi:3-oxoacyl-[acyl-carrier protein] reductase
MNVTGRDNSDSDDSNSSVGRFSKWSVAVLGGSGVLGSAAARAFGREGASVAIGFRKSETEARIVANSIIAAGGVAYCLQVDVCDSASLEEFFKNVMDRQGGVDVLVNAFGRIDAADAVRFDRVDPVAWDRLFEIDVKGTMLACRAALPYLRMSNHAAIVNFSGSYGNGTNQENLVSSVAVAYCAAKGAVRGFTAALARDLAPNIRVNAIAPGMIEANWDADWNIPQEHLDEAIAATALGRMGRPEEVAQTVLYLASEGSGYLTGQTLQFDGGWTFTG